MTRAPERSRALAVRWPVPFGALAVGCGLAVLVYQWGAVPLPPRPHAQPDLGSVAHVRVPPSADAPPRTVLRPSDVTQQLFVAVQLAPAAATVALRPAPHGIHLATAQHHHTVLLSVVRPAMAPPSLQVVGPTQPPLVIPTPPPVTTDPGSTVPPAGTGTTPDPGTTTGSGTTTPDPGTTPTGTTTDPGTTTGSGTTTPGTGTTDPGTTVSGTGTPTTGTVTTDPTTTTGTGTTTDVTAPAGTTPAAPTATDTTSLPAA